MKKIGIYLAGSIQKGHESSQKLFWTEEHMTSLRHHFREYEVLFLNPALRMDNLADSHSVFGRDMTQVFCSHVVFVDARDRKGLGVGSEMMWAKLNYIPVVSWAPKDTHYNKSKTTLLGVEVENFVHPFIQCLSDKIVSTLEEGAQWIEQMMTDPTIEIKGIKHVHASMEYYQETQLSIDLPMREILSCEELSSRLVRPIVR